MFKTRNKTEELIWVIHMKLFILCLHLRMLKTQILYSVIEDASLQLITTKIFQWEFGPPGGSWAECREQKAWGMEPCMTPGNSWSGKDEEKNGRLNHKKQMNKQLKGGWLHVLKTAGRLGKKGMDCWMLSREGNYFWLWVLALIHIIFKAYICICHDKQPESKCWKFAFWRETSLLWIYTMKVTGTEAKSIKKFLFYGSKRWMLLTTWNTQLKKKCLIAAFLSLKKLSSIWRFFSTKEKEQSYFMLDWPTVVIN